MKGALRGQLTNPGFLHWGWLVKVQAMANGLRSMERTASATLHGAADCWTQDVETEKTASRHLVSRVSGQSLAAEKCVPTLGNLKAQRRLAISRYGTQDSSDEHFTTYKLPTICYQQTLKHYPSDRHLTAFAIASELQLPFFHPQDDPCPLRRQCVHQPYSDSLLFVPCISRARWTCCPSAPN